MQMRKVYRVGFVSMLVIAAYLSAAIAKPSVIPVPPKRADIPTWYDGDRWIYEGNIQGYGENWTMNATIQDLKLKVVCKKPVQINDETYICYKVNITGHIEGNFTWEMTHGKITGEISGYAYYRMSDLSQVKTEIHSHGEIELAITHTYNFNLTSIFRPPLEYFDFPVKIGDEWDISSNAHMEGNVSISDLYEKEISTEKSLSKSLVCSGIEIISTPAGTFQTFTITDNNGNYSYYSPEVGNIVKGTIFYSAENVTVYGYIELKSYHRVVKPISIDLNLFPHEYILGESVKIYGNASYTDNGEPVEGADIEILIPSLNETFTTTTNEDGYFEVLFEPQDVIHDSTPCDREIGSDGVIVLCEFHTLEGYKVKTLVCIAHNTAPEKPIIVGINKGYTNQSYTFMGYAYDLNYDPLYYKFSWGDGSETDWIGLVDPDKICETEKIWNRSGTFEVKVKAKDFRGGNSSWSDPITVEIRPEVKVDINGPYYAQPGEPIKFEANVTGGYPPYSYHWIFGDGTESYEESPTHAYEREGIYNVTLIVKDNLTYITSGRTKAIIGVGDETPPTIKLVKPWKGIYFRNEKIMPFFITIVIGSVDIEFDVTDESGVNYATLYINGEEVKNFTSEPYIWRWSERTFGLSEIKIVSADTFGNVATATYYIWKFF